MHPIPCLLGLVMVLASLRIGWSAQAGEEFVGPFPSWRHLKRDFDTGHTWGSPTTICGNRIINPQDDFALRLGNAGPYLVMDTAQTRARSSWQTPTSRCWHGRVPKTPLARVKCGCEPTKLRDE